MGPVAETFETFCGMGVSVPSSHRFTILCWNTPISPSGKMRSLSNLLSRSLFLGNIPDTAWRMICETDAREKLNSGGLSVPWHCVAHLVRFPLHHILVLDLFQTPRIHRVFAVQHLVLLATRDLDLLGVGHNHIVTTVGLR